jgi:antagonist of KipI
MAPEPARILVVKPGLLTTVQDLGRPGWQRFGMPVGGAMDQLALRLANRLVGNPDGAAGLEITLIGPTLRFVSGARIALTGADLSPALDGRPVPLWTTVTAPPGTLLTFGERRAGARAYLAVAGGLDVPVVLGSRATHVPSRTGGHEGRALAAGDELRGGPPGAEPVARAGPGVPPDLRPIYAPSPVLRVLSGPRVERFTPRAVATLVSHRYALSHQCDRMGYRLLGPTLDRRDGGEIVSEAMPLGALQVPPHGQPILLMADRQTTGGYPVLAVVISSDLPLAAQLAPGDRVGFALVGIEAAQARLREQRARLDAALPPVGS